MRFLPWSWLSRAARVVLAVVACAVTAIAPGVIAYAIDARLNLDRTPFCLIGLRGLLAQTGACGMFVGLMRTDRPATTRGGLGVTRPGRTPHLGWSLLALWWLVACLAVAMHAVECLWSLCDYKKYCSAETFVTALTVGFVAQIALPLAVTLPAAVWMLWRRSGALPGLGQRWVLVSLVVCFVDVVLLEFCLATIVGMKW